MFKYDCIYCDKEMEGSFGNNVYCQNCDITFETEWDYISQDSMSAWLTNKEHKGKKDL